MLGTGCFREPVRDRKYCRKCCLRAGADVRSLFVVVTEGQRDGAGGQKSGREIGG